MDSYTRNWKQIICGYLSSIYNIEYSHIMFPPFNVDCPVIYL